MFAGSTKRFYRKKFFIPVPWVKTLKGQTILTVVSFVIFAISVLYIFWNLAIADGSGKYAASDVLGEFKAFSGGEFGGPANSFGFWDPTDVVVDTSNHRLFVADGGQFYNNRVLIYSLDSNDNISTQAANFVLGEPDMNTIQGYVAPVTQSTMQSPSNIAFDDTNNRLFVSDKFDNRILVFNLTSVSNGMAAVNVLGQTDFVSSGSATTQSTLKQPANLAFDVTNQLLYVNDSGNKRILEYDLSGGINNGMNAAHVIGAANFTTLGGGGGSSGFTTTTGLALDTNNNHLFVTDAGGFRVLEFDLSGGINNGMAASHVFGAANPTLNGPSSVTQHNFKTPNALTYDTLNNVLYVSDTGAFRILKFDLSGAISNNMNATLVFGQTNFTNSTIPTSPTQNNINESFGMSYDAATNHLFAADLGYNRILNFDFSVASSSGENASSEIGQTDLNDNATFTEGYINDFSHFANQYVMYPKGSVVDTVNHRLYVADFQGARVMIYNLDSNNNFVDRTAIAELGQPDYETIFSNGSPPTQARLSGPTGIAYDSTKSLLYVEDPGFNRILVYDLSGAITNGMNAAFVLGQPDFVTNTTGQTDSNFLNDPTGGLVFDPTTSDLYVGDTGNNRVMIFDTGGLSNGMSASHVLGQPDFTSNASNVTQAGFSSVSGLAIDPSQTELFVGDAHRALVFNIATLIDNMNATHVLGEPNFVSDPWASNVDNKSFNPFGFAFDNHNQRLFIEDQDNDRILSYDFSSGIVDGMAASAVIGQSNFTDSVSDTIPPSAYDFGTVNGTADAFDTTNNRLYISDGLYGRLLIFNLVNLLPLTQTSFTVGDSFSQVLGSQYQGTPSYSITSGSLPPGLVLDSASGDLGGIFTTPGVFNFTVKVIDNNNTIGSFSDFQPYSITVAATSSATPTDTPAVSGSPTNTPAPTSGSAGPTSTPGPTPTPTGGVTAPSTGLGTNRPNVLIASMAAGSSALSFFSGLLLLHKRRRI